MNEIRKLGAWVFAAILLGSILIGGLFNTVQSSTGGFYLVNRLTGQTWYCYGKDCVKAKDMAPTQPKR